MSASRKELAPDDPRHGTVNGYKNLGCRCEPCRAAKRERDARYYAENAETIRERNARYYAETARKELAADDPRHGTTGGYVTCGCRCEPCSDARREYDARYYAENAEKLREYQARYYAENAETIRERNACYYAENAEKAREYQARYRAENAEKLREYRATPEGRAVDRAAGRRRRERARLHYCGCDTRENLHAIWVMDEGLCAYCGAEGTDYEHVVPLARGGWGCISNFRIACKSCNSRKGTKPLSVFLDRLAASGVDIRPGATNSGLPCLAAAARMAARMLPAGSA